MRKIIRLKKASFYYHVTRKNFGDSIVLYPKHITGADEREPDIKRICVAPTISGCFAAIHNDEAEYNIYRTKNKVLAYKPYNVFDSSVTKEKWLLRSSKFIRVGKIKADIAERFPSSTRGDEKQLFLQIQEKNEIKSIIQKEIKKNNIVIEGYCKV